MISGKKLALLACALTLSTAALANIKIEDGRIYMGEIHEGKPVGSETEGKGINIGNGNAWAMENAESDSENRGIVIGNSNERITNRSVVIGNHNFMIGSTSTPTGVIAIGNGIKSNGRDPIDAVAIGYHAEVAHANAVALGTDSVTKEGKIIDPGAFVENNNIREGRSPSDWELTNLLPKAKKHGLTSRRIHMDFGEVLNADKVMSALTFSEDAPEGFTQDQWEAYKGRFARSLSMDEMTWRKLPAKPGLYNLKIADDLTLEVKIGNPPSSYSVYDPAANEGEHSTSGTTTVVSDPGRGDRSVRGRRGGKRRGASLEKQPPAVVSIGAAGAERQLVNLAPGEISETSTDAINGAQMYAMIRRLRTGDLLSENDLSTWKQMLSSGSNGLALKSEAGAGASAPDLSAYAKKSELAPLAKKDGSNFDVAQVASKLGTGENAAGNTNLVTGGTLHSSLSALEVKLRKELGSGGTQPANPGASSGSSALERRVATLEKQQQSMNSSLQTTNQTAQGAKSQAGSNKTAIDSLKTKTGTLEKTAAAAKSTAESALKAARGVEAKAASALSSAAEAKAKAKEAKEAAQTAETLARGVDAKAQRALSDAAAAKKTAEGIDTKATKAMTDAESAKRTAEGIDAKATKAMADASSARKTAEGIDGKATRALEESSAARSAAQSSAASALNAAKEAKEAKDFAAGLDGKISNAVTRSEKAEQAASEALSGVRGKAERDGSNLTAKDLVSWTERLGTGEVAKGNGSLVTGDAVYRAFQAKGEELMSRVERETAKGAAMTLAAAGMPVAYDKSGGMTASLGHYKGQTAFALGGYRYLTPSVLAKGAVTTAGDGVGLQLSVTYTFGQKTAAPAAAKADAALLQLMERMDRLEAENRALKESLKKN